MKVIVTRPQDQADYLIQQLTEIGCEAIPMPILNIEAVELSAASRQALIDIDLYKAVIAISANAANYGIAAMDAYWPQWPVGIEWLAVGPATKEVMEASGLETRMPDVQFDSEGLLMLDSLQAEQVQGEKILIWRGIGGRETLATELRQRGAVVDYAELYERLVPQYDESQWLAATQPADVLVISSGQGLTAVMEQFPQMPKQVPAIIAPSERVATMAKQYGFEHIVISDSARDEDTISSIKCWKDSLTS